MSDDAQMPAEAPAETEVATSEQTEFKPFYQELPETWRDDMVKGLELGESEQNVLNRYTDFPSFGKAFFEQHKKIRSGVTQSDALPANATEDQIKEYREANGIPLEAGEYKSTLPEGFVSSEEDERILERIWGEAHALNVKPEVVGALQKAWMDARMAEEEREMAQHGLDQQQATAQMKEHWGPDFETNLNAIRGLMNTIPAEAKEELEHAFTPSGKKVFNDPNLVQWFADVARKLNPGVTVVPNASNPTQAIDSEIKKIEKVMEEEPDEYWGDPDMQKRYQDLLAAQEQYQKSSAA